MIHKVSSVSGNGAAWKAVIVERSSEFQLAMIRQLQAHGFDVAATLDRPNHAAVEVRAHRADLLILGVQEGEESVLKSIEDLAAEFRNLRVIVTAPAAEPELILKVLRAGASEFLVRPVSSDELAQALDRVARSLQPPPEANGEIIAVYSGKGGIGSTTVAVNLAFAMAKQHRGTRVALVDMVLYGGDVQVFLDMNPVYSVADLLGKPGRIDGQLLDKIFHHHSGKVWVLAGPRALEDMDSIGAEQVTEVLVGLRSHFDFVIVDCEHHLNERSLAVLDTADKVLTLTVLNVPAVRQLQRTLDIFGRLGYAADKVKLVVNRHQQKDVLSVRDIEKTLDRPAFWQLPNDYRSAIDAITRGKPLAGAAPRSKLTQSFEKFATTLGGTDSRRARPRPLSARMRRMFEASKR